jgi:hypothetical protein
MPEQHPPVDFDYDNRDVTRYTWLAFWDSIRSWLAERGYTLFEYRYHWESSYCGYVTHLAPKLNTLSVSDVEHPFCKSGGDPEDLPVLPLSGRNVVRPFVFHVHSVLIGFKERITFAQDSLQRHVVLKLTKKSSNEYKILQFLIKESIDLSLEKFEGVLPHLNLLDFGDYCIAVMPRYSILLAP